MFLIKKVPNNLNKLRIDRVLAELKMVDSRNQALALIIEGNVFVNDIRVVKPGKIINSDTIIKIKKKDYHWVSRGGKKLSDALTKLDLSMNNKVCIDIGCSTGGFTHVLLDGGVEKVYAVDVGYGQFDWKLRNSNKVTLLERTNARSLSKKNIPEHVDVIVCDVSFISVKKIFVSLKQFLKPSYQIISLIKPQFEVSREEIGKGGIIRDPLIHRKVCEDLESWFKTNFNHNHIEILESSILGQKGNKEFFVYLKY